MEMTRDKELVGSNGSLILLHSLLRENKTFMAYDWSRELVDEFGQINYHDEAFYYPNNVFRFEIRHGKFYTIEGKTKNKILSVVDQNSGKVLNSVKINDSEKFHVDEDGRLILMENERCIYMNHLGDIVKEINMKNLPNVPSWCFDNNDIMFAFDKNTKKLFIKNFLNIILIN